MDNRLNGKTQIWADGYSFMEVTDTLLMALGIRLDEPPAESSPAGDKARPVSGSAALTADVCATPSR